MIKIGNRIAVGGLVAALLIFAPSSAFAIGLGKLKVHSALDEPLNAEIPFTSLSSRERKKLQAKLANRQEFQSAQIDRSPHLSSLKFNVAKRVDGRYFLQLRTEEPFREPFLHLLIKVEWAGGRLIREYSALIDPPYLVAGKSSGIETPVIQSAPAGAVSQVEPIEPVAEQVPEALSGAIEPLPVEEVKPEPQPEAEQPVAEAVAEPVPESAPEGEPAEPVEPVAATVTELEPVEAEPETLESDIFAPADVGPVAMDDSGWPIDPVDAAVDDEEADLEASLALNDEEPLVEPLEPVEAEEVKTEEVAKEPEVVAEKPEPIEPVFEPEPIAPISSFDEEAVSDSYSVKRGDTMWEIAEQVKAGSNYQHLSVQQIVMAIYQKNRHAFYKPNVNNLKAGKILDIPESETVSGSSHGAARKQFRTHYSAWQEYKLKRASAATAITVDKDAVKPEPKKEKIAVEKKPAEKKPAPKEKAKPVEKAKAKPKETSKPTPKLAKKPEAKPKAQPQPKAKSAEDLLRIVRSNLKKDANKAKAPDAESTKDKTLKEKSSLADRMAKTEESIESSKLRNKETGERVGQVKEQLAKQKRLMELENAKLAQTRQGSQKPAADKKPAVSTGKTDKASQKPRVKPRPQAKPQPPQPKKGFVEEMMDTVSGLISDTTSLTIIGAVVGVVLLLVGLTVRRRRQAKMEFEESILNSTMDSEVSDTGEQTGDEGDTSFLSDFSQTNMNNISTDEVDPIAEAEVYLAYGRDEQAEEILREAIAKDAGRHEVHEKLLEIYHQREDTGAFETLAEELYAALGGQGGELWSRVAAMGMKLNPSNPMFSGEGGPPAGVAGATAPMDQPGTESLADTLEGAESLDFDSPDMGGGGGEESQETMVMPSDGSLDMGMDMGTGAEEEQPEALDMGLDMGGLDIGGAESPAAEEPVAEEAAAAEEDDAGIEFNLDFDGGLGDDSGGTEAAGAEEVAEAPADDDGGLDFEMDASGLDMGSEEVSMDGADSDALALDSSADDLDFGLDEESADAGAEESELSLDMGSEDEGESLEMEAIADDSEVSDDIAGELNLEDVSGDDLQWDADSDANTVDTGEVAMAENSADLDMEGDSVLAMEDSELDEGDSVLAMEEPSEMGELDAGEEDSEQWDETATKLDLAKAYIDMGDAEGAKSILDEVMEEGNDEQKKQAEELAAQVA